MPEKRRTTSPKARVGKAVLKRASKVATRKASTRAFKHVRTLLVVKGGWLVRVNARGQVVEKVKRIPLPKVA